MNLKEKLANFIQTRLNDDNSIIINDEDDLIERGLIDSIGLIQIVSFIEEETGISISDENILPDNFKTVNSINNMIQDLQN